MNYIFKSVEVYHKEYLNMYFVNVGVLNVFINDVKMSEKRDENRRINQKYD